MNFYKTIRVRQSNKHKMKAETLEKLNTYIQSLKDKDPNLTKLNISNNNIGDEEAKTIAEALGEGGNTTLTSLDISDNDIQDDGITYIAEALCKDNKTLTELNISYNYLGSKGLAALTNVLEKNKSLRKLNIKSISYIISLEEVKAVVKALKDNTTLIDLQMNGLGNASIEYINEVNKVNTKLKVNQLESYITRLNKNEPTFTSINITNKNRILDI